MSLLEDTVELRVRRLRRETPATVQTPPADVPRTRASHVIAWVLVVLLLAAVGELVLATYGVLAALAVVWLAPAALFLAAVLIGGLVPEEPSTRR